MRVSQDIMSTQDLWTEIFDGIQAVYIFLSGDLSRESLSKINEQKRTKFAKSLEGLLNKIEATHAIQNSDTPSRPPPPPVTETTPPKPEPPPIPDHEPTDYLAFEPAQLEGEEPQEVYEAMEPEIEIEQDVYEATDGGDDPSEVYEEPVPSRPSTSNGSLPGTTPPGSQENSGSGVHYMEANRSNLRPPDQQENGDISMEWSSVYQIPSAATKLKVAQLEGISIKGPLEKLGGKSHRTWQRRYCVLAGPLMYFYEKENSKTFNNFIAIPSFSVEFSEKMSDKKHFAFKLTQQDHTGKKKDYCFRSTSSENCDKWVNAMKKVIDVANTQKSRSAITLPRLPSHPGGTASPIPQEKRRSLSLDIPEEPQELYEPVDPVTGGDEEDTQDDYVAVSPEAQLKEDLESSEEYIDVEPGAREDEPTEVYEEPPIMLEAEEEPPPPPTSPPPGPPRDHPFPPSSSPVPPRPITPEPPPATLPPKPAPSSRSIPIIAKKPALPPPPTEDTVNTNKVYVQSVNGISLEKVFVSLWDFAAGERDEINLKRGDLILVKDPKENADWWFGELLDKEATRKLGKSGFFPRTYASHAFEAIS